MRQADGEKRHFIEGMRGMGYTTHGSEWVPEGQIYHDALRVREQLEESRRHSLGTCKHTQQTWASSEEAGAFDDDRILPEDDSSKELLASNDAFHWAAQIHLFRRVFNYKRDHLCIRDAIKRIIEAMQVIPEKSNVGNAVLFPLFTAGCESTTAEDREYILQRLLGIENSGMNQFQRARILMQKVWETGSSWESLINGEFIG
ncbi:hypothetical protein TWF106_010861 [Orbilia oligospora]|nr:hypothetical protein TWF106_010861 [Orbilia oligospora]